MIDFGIWRPLDLRTVWKSESRDFTRWLSENLDGLGEALGLDLELTEIEAAVGPFFCDLLAKDLATDRVVVIENQLEQTDHDHLGKLLTYAAGHKAGVLIWIAREIREEHRAAILWLNEHTDTATDFFGVVVQVIQIDDSRPAFRFEVEARPDEWQKKTLVTSGHASSSRQEQYREFFQQLIDELRDTYRFTNARLGQPTNWYQFSTGVAGVRYIVNFGSRNRVRVERYIDLGEFARNKGLFDTFLQDRPAIERELDQPLEWERLDERRASRIAAYRPGSFNLDLDQAEIRKWAIHQLLQFKKVFGPKIRPFLDISDAILSAGSATDPVSES